MKDIEGIELNIGDVVLYARQTYSANGELVKCVIKNNK